jgi:hypothetical protein
LGYPEIQVTVSISGPREGYVMTVDTKPGGPARSGRFATASGGKDQRATGATGTRDSRNGKFVERQVLGPDGTVRTRISRDVIYEALADSASKKR